MTAALDVCGLSRRYPAAEVDALTDLDLSVPTGGCVALLGPSGSGKTTALRLIAGLDTPDTGDIRVGGANVLALPPERRGLSMVSQRPTLFPHLSVLDNVAFAPRMSGASRRAARAAAAGYLDLVQLGGFANRRPATLSGGQAQRVALARGLAAEPSVLLLDEPFSALDPSLRTDMHALLAEVRAVLEPTIVLVTHDQQEAATLADSIAIVIAGNLLQHGDVAQLYSAPASLQVFRFLGGRNEFPGVVEQGVHVSGLGLLQLSRTTHVSDGPAVLVVRQEAVGVVEPNDDAADTAGEVTCVAVRGPWSLVEVATPAGPLVAELPTGRAPRPGQLTGVVLPLEARAVVPLRGARDADRDGLTSSLAELGHGRG